MLHVQTFLSGVGKLVYGLDQRNLIVSCFFCLLETAYNICQISSITRLGFSGLSNWQLVYRLASTSTGCRSQTKRKLISLLNIWCYGNCRIALLHLQKHDHFSLWCVYCNRILNKFVKRSCNYTSVICNHVFLFERKCYFFNSQNILSAIILNVIYFEKKIIALKNLKTGKFIIKSSSGSS